MANPQVHIRLDPRDMAKLTAQADRLCLTHTQLARSYILIGILKRKDEEEEREL